MIGRSLGRIGNAQVAMTLDPGAQLSGWARLHLPAGHRALQGGACYLTLNPGLELIGWPYRRLGRHWVCLPGVGDGPLDLLLRVRGRLVSDTPLMGYATESEWFLPAWTGWFPYVEATRLRIKVRARGLNAVLPGVLTAGEWSVHANVPPTLALGKWPVQSSSDRTMGVSHPALPALLDRAGRYLVERYAGWPFGRLNVAQLDNLSMEGLSLPALVLVNPGLCNAADSDPRHMEGLLVHELAHQWFGNAVPAAESWFAESLAEWERMTFLADTWGADAADELLAEGIGLHLAMQRLHGRHTLDQADRLRNGSSVVFDGLAYGPGLLLLLMMERRVGDARFREALRRLSRGPALNLKAFCDALDHSDQGDPWYGWVQSLTGTVLTSAWFERIGVDMCRVEATCNRFLTTFRPLRVHAF